MRKWIAALLSVCLLMIFAGGCASANKIKNPYVQEYVAGEGNCKGNVDAEYFRALDERFEIGADREGYAVFKDPKQAYEALLENYADGIARIREEFGLDALSQENYLDYKIYGWQLAGGTDAEREQASFVSKFFDIYENSF